MNAQQALEAIQFLEQDETHNNNEDSSPEQRSSPNSSSPLSLRLSPVASRTRSAVSTPSCSSYDNVEEEEESDERNSPYRNSEASFPAKVRESSPIRTAFANLLEMSFESKLSHDADDPKVKEPKTPMTIPQLDPERDTRAAPPSLVTESVNIDDSKPAQHTAPARTHAPIQPISHSTPEVATVDTSSEYDDSEDDDDDEDDSFLESFESSTSGMNSSSLKSYGVNEKSIDDSLEISGSSRNYSIHVQSNSILEKDNSNLSKVEQTEVSIEPATTSFSKEGQTRPINEDFHNMDTTAADRLDAKLDGLLSSTKGEETPPEKEVGGVAMRVNQTFHKIKELATPFLPTRLPKPACQPVENKDVKAAYTTKQSPNRPSNDITAITVIDTSHITSVPSDERPSKPLVQTDQQRVPMMRMRNPAVQDFLAEHEGPLSTPQEESEDEFMQRKSQQWKEKKKQADKQLSAERKRLENLKRMKETLNGPDDIIACNSGLWKDFENFVVTRCGDVSDVLVDKTKGNEGGSQYSPECSAASDDEKSEDSASMMRRLSARYLRKDTYTVTSSVDGSAVSNRSTTDSTRALDVPFAVLKPVRRRTTSGREIPPAPPTSSPTARESIVPIDKNVIEQFIHKTQNEGLDILIHKKVQADDLAGPLRARAYLQDGKKGNGGELCAPWLVWYAGDSKMRKGIDLFDIRSLDKASALQLEQYPLAIPGRSLFLRMNEGSDHVFEMQDEAAAVQFVHGMRWLIARLSYSLILGNVHVSCEMLELDESQIRSQLVESHRTSTMNELTNQLVDKSAASM